VVLTVPEVANELRVTPAHVYALIRAGTLAHVRVGRCIRIADTVLAQFIASGGRRQVVAEADGGAHSTRPD
jgi:excisionase family DNA binding protein